MTGTNRIVSRFAASRVKVAMFELVCFVGGFLLLAMYAYMAYTVGVFSQDSHLN